MSIREGKEHIVTGYMSTVKEPFVKKNVDEAINAMCIQSKINDLVESRVKRCLDESGLSVIVDLNRDKIKRFDDLNIDCAVAKVLYQEYKGKQIRKVLCDSRLFSLFRRSTYSSQITRDYKCISYNIRLKDIPVIRCSIPDYCALLYYGDDTYRYVFFI